MSLIKTNSYKEVDTMFSCGSCSDLLALLCQMFGICLG